MTTSRSKKSSSSRSPKTRAQLQLGTIVNLDREVDQKFAQVVDLGVKTVQLACWQPRRLTAATAKRVVTAAERHGLTITSYWAGYSGPAVWDFLKGPQTIGLVPERYRKQRTQELIAATDFAQAIGAPSITTHLGFLPENPRQPDYRPILTAARKVADAADRLGLGFWFETGQETPVTLWRFITDLDGEHVGVNFDPANLIMYGKASPLDAFDILGPWVRGFHAKDGLYPAADPRQLGEETPLGKGAVPFPELLKRLKRLKYKGAITLEREITGPEQHRDLKAAIRTLQPHL